MNPNLNDKAKSHLLHTQKLSSEVNNILTQLSQVHVIYVQKKIVHLLSGQRLRRVHMKRYVNK